MALAKKSITASKTASNNVENVKISVNVNKDKTTTATVMTNRRSDNPTVRVTVKTTEDLGTRLIRSIPVRTTEDLGTRRSRSIPEAMDVFGDGVMDGITDRRRVPLSVQSLFPFAGRVIVRSVTSEV